MEKKSTSSFEKMIQNKMKEDMSKKEPSLKNKSPDIVEDPSANISPELRKGIQDSRRMQKMKEGLDIYGVPVETSEDLDYEPSIHKTKGRQVKQSDVRRAQLQEKRKQEEEVVEAKKKSQAELKSKRAKESEEFKNLKIDPAKEYQKQTELIEKQTKELKDKTEKNLKEISKSTDNISKSAAKSATGSARNLAQKTASGAKSLAGLLPAAAAAGISMYAPESKAATVANTVSRITEEGDPTSLLFPAGAGEGEEAEVKKMREEQKNEYYKNLMRNMPEDELVRSEEDMPVLDVLGEEIPTLNYSDIQDRMRKKLGYK